MLAFDCRPGAIATSPALWSDSLSMVQLDSARDQRRGPNYQENADYCHVSREPVTVDISLNKEVSIAYDVSNWLVPESD